MFVEDIQDACHCYPHRLACINAGGSVTFGALWQRACRLARAWQHGSAPVMVYGEKHPDMLAVFVACLLCGRAYVPVAPHLPKVRVQQYIDTVNPEFLVAFAPYSGSSVRVISASELDALATAGEAGFYPAVQDMEKPAYIIFTSGSTGLPKAVPITLGNLNHFIHWLRQHPTVRQISGKTIFSSASYSFDLSVAPLYLCLTQGNTLAEPTAEEAADLPRLLARIKQSGCDMMVCTPTFLHRCLQAAAFSLALAPSLTTVFLCGEVLLPATARLMKARFPGVHVLNAYGPTEATCAVCMVELTEAHLAQESLPIGKLADAAAQVTVVGCANQPRPDGEWGQIVLSGKSVSPGYLHAPQNGQSFFKRGEDNAYATGDIGRICNGLLYFGGRADDQFKYKGYRIEPGEVEAAISACCGGAACVATGVQRKGQVAWVAAVVETIDSLDIGALKQRLETMLPAYMIPRFIRTMGRFPTNANGKHDRKQIKEWLEQDA